MKKYILAILCILSFSNIFAQIKLTQTISSALSKDDPTQTVTGIDSKNAIQIIESVAKELKYSLAQYDEDNKILITDWFEWSTVMIPNRAKLRFEAKDNSVIISMTDREYKSDKGWAKTLTGPSKKNIEKYIGSFAEKIKTLNSNNKLLTDALWNSELIKIFKPSVTVENLECRFTKGSRDVVSGEGKYQKTNTPNIVLEIAVTNKNEKEAKVKLVYANIKSNNLKNWGVSGSPFVSFNELNTSLGYRTTELAISPGETKNVFIYTLLSKEPNYCLIPEFILRIMIDGNQKDLVNHNILIPFENKF